MPAKSKSQQRLFGMVQAYNEGEFRGSGALRRRVAELARRISAEDAEHFARTSHDGLPEKRAQVMYTPEELSRIYARMPVGAALAFAAGGDEPRGQSERSVRRRSLLGSVVRGGAVGTVVGGLGSAALGAFLARKAAAGVPDLQPAEVSARIRDAALRTGLWGATRGAAIGAVAGGGLNLLGRARE